VRVEIPTDAAGAAETGSQGDATVFDTQLSNSPTRIRPGFACSFAGHARVITPLAVRLGVAGLLFVFPSP
jgi:hypothetical protein